MSNSSTKQAASTKNRLCRIHYNLLGLNLYSDKHYLTCSNTRVDSYCVREESDHMRCSFATDRTDIG
jgi:hypothetical protein